MRTFGVDADLRAVVLQGGTLVDVLADLGVLLRGDVAAVAGANVAAARQVLATVAAAAVGHVRTRTLQMAAALVRFVLAVVLKGPPREKIMFVILVTHKCHTKSFN